MLRCILQKKANSAVNNLVSILKRKSYSIAWLVAWQYHSCILDQKSVVLHPISSITFRTGALSKNLVSLPTLNVWWLTTITTADVSPPRLSFSGPCSVLNESGSLDLINMGHASAERAWLVDRRCARFTTVFVTDVGSGPFVSPGCQTFIRRIRSNEFQLSECRSSEPDSEYDLQQLESCIKPQFRKTSLMTDILVQIGRANFGHCSPQKKKTSVFGLNQFGNEYYQNGRLYSKQQRWSLN